MTHLQKLQISGVRSFGPNDEDRQSMNFYTEVATNKRDSNGEIIKEKHIWPLTLILGQNGCGKTTIIECLKYVTTGDCPPGSYQGKSFVHDPKMANEVSVRGFVKLGFRGIDRKYNLVSRGLEATQKPKSISMKTLDCTITKKDEVTGENRSLSMKCSDINTHILNALGVSKPILNYVVFCHQEDSNWPLEEGSKVKAKFDEIFASDKYQDCLKEFKVVKAKNAADLKLLTQDRIYHNEFKKEAEEKASVLENANTKVQVLLGEIGDCEEELKPVMKDLEKIRQLEVNYSDLIGDKAKSKALLEEKQKQIKELETHLKSIFDLNSDTNFARLEREETEKKNDIETDLNECKNEIKVVKEGMDKDEKEIGIAMGLIGECRSKHRENLKVKNTLVRKINGLATECDFEKVDEEDLTANNLDSVLEKINDMINDQDLALRQNSQGFDAKIEGKSTEISQQRTEMALLAQQRDRLYVEVKDKSDRLREINLQLSDAEGSSEKIAEIDEKIENKRSALKEIGDNFDFKSIREKVEQQRKELCAWEKKEKELKDEKSIFDLNQAVVCDINIKNKDLEEKMGELEITQRKCKSSLEDIFGEKIPSHSNLRREFTSKMDLFSNTKRALETEHNKLDVSHNILKEKRNQLRSDIQKTSRKVEATKEKIGDNMNLSEDIEHVLDSLKLEITKRRDELAQKEANKFTYQGFISQLAAELDDAKTAAACCPTCNRGFKNEKEARELIEDLQQEIKRIPKNVKSLKDHLESKMKKQETLTALLPEYKQMRELSLELDDMNTKLVELETELKSLSHKLKTIGAEVLEESTRLSQCEVIRDKVTKIDTLNTQIEELQNQVNELNSKVSDIDTSKTLEHYQKEEQKITQMLKKNRKEIEFKQNLELKKQKEINDLEMELNSLSQQKLDFQKKQQDVTTLIEEKKCVVKVCEENQNEVKSIKNKLVELKDVEQLLERERNKLLAAKDSELKKLSQKLDSLKSSTNEVQSLIESVKIYGSSDNDLSLLKHSENLADMRKRKTLREITLSEWEAKKANLESDIESQSERIRELRDNIRLFNCKMEAEKCSKKVQELEKRLDSRNFSSELSKKKGLEKLKTDLEGKRSEKNGRLREARENVRQQERELKQDKYKNAVENYRKICIQHRCKQHVINDLEKYYKALNFAISKFHKEKMRVINKYIRELWKQTYKGNDIDFIEIKTDDIDPNASMDKRKVCNYRVMMVKNNTEMEMRGRCSAGQKVLASLLIRLALAETFSLNCGIIALDEPTTNLDRDNIESLSDALAEIVEKRSKANKNFQLIVITHDEELIEKLGRKVPDQNYYYKVSRNHKGLSQIKKRTIDGN